MIDALVHVILAAIGACVFLVAIVAITSQIRLKVFRWREERRTR